MFKPIGMHVGKINYELLYHFIHTLYIYIKNKYTGMVFWSIFTVYMYLRNLHIHIHHLPDLKK